MFYGRGAGKLPTASAVVGDIIDVAKCAKNDPCYPALEDASDADVADISSYCCKNMLVFDAKADDAVLDAFNASQAVVRGGKVAFITEALSEKELNEKLALITDAPTSRIRLI